MMYEWTGETGKSHIHRGEIKLIEDVIANIRIEKVECDDCNATKIVSYNATVRSNI